MTGGRNTGSDRTGLADRPARDAQALYQRGVARLRLGRDAEARADLVAAREELGDLAGVELTYLDLRGRAPVENVVFQARELAERAPASSWLRARALHVLGHALGQAGRCAEAADALTQSLELHGELGNRLDRAQVYDTLGMLYASRGVLESAISYYALSLVEKHREGDTHGAAITLGNLGRLHLRAGRLREAQECFELDLDLAVELGDLRACGRMWNDLGRVRIEQEDLDQAQALQERCLAHAERHGFHDQIFFAHKDLVRIAVARAQHEPLRNEALAVAEGHLRAARKHMPAGQPYAEFLLRGVEAEVLRARGASEALGVLSALALDLAETDFPDIEVPVLIALAEELERSGNTRAAEDGLARALERAQRDGYARYLPTIREAMGRLDLKDIAANEAGRLDLGNRISSEPDGYTLLRQIGSGAFGDVYRALDPRTNRVVAIKVLRLETLYDPRRRRRLAVSARMELEAVSRIRHPGIARVFATGTDSRGHTYLVQELVDGRPLHEVVRGPLPSSPQASLRMARRIAEALEELHAHGVVHRDLKPENVLVRSKDGTPVLVDFGIAYVPDDASTLPADERVGTLLYMAPEQVAGSPVNDRSDVYSLGVVLSELWCPGRAASNAPGGTAPSAEELRHGVGQGTRDPALVTRLAHLLGRMLAEERDDRPSAADLAMTLRELEELAL